MFFLLELFFSPKSEGLKNATYVAALEGGNLVKFPISQALGITEGK